MRNPHDRLFDGRLPTQYRMTGTDSKQMIAPNRCAATMVYISVSDGTGPKPGFLGQGYMSLAKPRYQR